SCEVNGDPHYYTFDNQVHHFMGTCTYTLSKLCENDGHLSDFNVEAANEHRGGNTRVSYVKYVNVDVHGYRITLEKNRVVKVDGNIKTLPVALTPGIDIFLSGHDVLVTTAFGLNVKFDGNHRVVVTIPREYANKVCGLCGNFNGNKTDDFLNPDGELEPDSNSLGNSWQVDNDTRCTTGPVQPNCTDEEKDTIASNSFCGIIIDKNGPFKDCHEVVNPHVYFDNCAYDLCELNLDPGSLCDSLQSYVQACQSHGIVISPWRNETFCPLKCPPNSHYEPCGTACPATCVNPASPSTCSLPCTEGCACDAGYVLYDKMCVPSSQCGCWEDGKHYPVGPDFWTDDTCTQKCKCPSAGGNLICESASCPSGKYCGITNGVPGCHDLSFGNCVVYGDPHYNTFDKQTHHFMGICTYTISKLCSNSTSLPYFNIEGKNEHRGNPTVSWIQKVMVEVYGYKITMEKNEPSRVLVNGIWTNLPVNLVNGSLVVTRSGRYVILETDFQLTVSYDTDHTVDVKVPTTYYNLTCGMCGNLNNDPKDDFLMPNGQLAQNSNQLGDSWKVEDDDDPLCKTIVPTPPPPCPPEEEERYGSEVFCGLLKNKNGPFKQCHSVINPERFFDSCVFDLCALGDGVLCTAIEAYADACQRAGVVIAWRNSSFCPIPCSSNSHYNACASACPATCLDQSAPNNCNKPCTDSCECDNGFVLSGSTCVPVSDCGCFYDGKYYQKNEIFWRGECESLCTCEGNNLVNCVDQSCSPNEICQVQNGVKTCVPKVTTTPTTTTTTLPPTPDACNLDCSFDVDVCNWKQSKNDDMDWIRWRGATPSLLTGPSFDHTTGDGYYLYIDGRFSNYGNIARLESPDNCFSGKHCLRFWYHMYGVADYMQLRVTVLRADGLEVMFDVMGNAGDVWRLEEIFLPDSDITKIFIEGFRGEDYRSDVAIDDISLVPGYCPVTPPSTTITTTTTTPTTTSTTTTTSPSLAPPGSCEVNGDPHYYTFDNQVHHFMGTCTYTLSKLCENDGHLSNFNVEAANEHRGGNTRVSYVKYVNVDVHGYRITLEKNRVVKVDGNIKTLPVALTPGIDIFLSGHDVLVTTAFGLNVKFDGNHRVVVTIPREYANKVCGLCGNFNGNKTDDFLNPDGELEPDSNSLGNSWQVDNDTRCTTGPVQPNCTDEEKDTIASNSFCGIIIDKNGPFKDCHEVVNPDVYFDNCAYDLCELNLDPGSLCDSLQSYVQACQSHGIVISPWRNETFCPLKCPPNSHYDPCGTACPATCVNPASPSTCSLPCTEGCACDAGYVLYDKMCVPSSQCGCWEDGKHYPVGPDFWTDDTCTQKCKCPSAGGNLICESASCPSGKYCGITNGVPGCHDLSFGNCVVYGDPHYNTFDKQTHHFMGICTYTISKLCSNSTSLPYFNIEGKNEHRGNPTVSWIQKVMVEVYGYKITMEKNEPSRVLVNGIWTNLPVNLVNGSLVVTRSGRYVILETDFQLTVSYDTDHTVDVKVPTTYYNLTCGMCGNLNNDPKDDFLMPNGQLAQNSNQLGDSWKVEDDDDPLCNTIVPTPPPPCPPEEEERYGSEAFCGLLKNKNGPFKQCHSVINPERFFDSCVFDLCALGDGVLCTAIEAYADACQRAGVVFAWRNSSFCPIPCSSNSHYNACASACPATCLDQNAPNNCNKPCTDSCECDDGFVLSGSTCVPVSDCGCFYDGKYYQKNEIFWRGECESLCTCEGNNLVNCVDKSCSPNEICQVQNGVKTCVPKVTTTPTTTTTTLPPKPGSFIMNGIDPNSPSVCTSGSCEVNGDPHYYTFDNQVHHFMGTCTYTLSKLCENDGHLSDFNVEAANEHRGGNTRVSYVKYVNVDVHGYRITLEKNRVVKVDGKIETLPVALTSGIDIFLSGHDVLVTTAFGLNVKFDGNHRVVVTIPREYANKVCGLCGNFNGNKTDDFLNPDGELEPDSNSLGNSWQVDNDTRCTSGPDTEPDCSDDEKVTISSNSFCGIITDNNGPFKDCHDVVDPTVYFNNCLYDLCELNLDPGALCDNLQSYVQSCQSNGVFTTLPLKDLYLQEENMAGGQSIKCPPNSHFEQCGTACPATCKNPGSPSNCNLPCTESCICDPGYVLYNNKCVPSLQCGCWENDRHHPVGSEFWKDDTCSTKCKCLSPGSSLVCNNDTCPSNQYCSVTNGVPNCVYYSYGACRVHNDPHYETFDKQTHHFMGLCTYTLTKLCTNSSTLPYFNVEAKNVHRGNPSVSYVQRVLIDVYGYRIQIINNEKSRILVNDIWNNLPVILNGGAVKVDISGRYVVLETDFKLKVSYDTDHSVEVKLPNTFSNEVCGMCGNFNNKRPDDFLMPNGQLAPNSNELGNSWIVYDKDDPFCLDQPPPPPLPTCPPEKENLYESDTFCGLLNSGLFSVCHSTVDPESFFESCVFDLCALDGGKDVLCSALEAYADACQKLGVTIPNWRNITSCGMYCRYKLGLFCKL
ncbi:IgGFc-binding protein-like, partial [Leptodactylus fuscus]